MIQIRHYAQAEFGWVPPLQPPEVSWKRNGSACQLAGDRIAKPRRSRLANKNPRGSGDFLPEVPGTRCYLGSTLTVHKYSAQDRFAASIPAFLGPSRCAGSVVFLDLT